MPCVKIHSGLLPHYKLSAVFTLLLLLLTVTVTLHYAICLPTLRITVLTKMSSLFRSCAQMCIILHQLRTAPA